MKLFSGEFFQCILIGLQHVDTSVHPGILKFILADHLLLSPDLKSGLGPMDDGISRSYDPEEHKNRCRNGHKPREFTMRAMKYVSYLSQN